VAFLPVSRKSEIWYKRTDGQGATLNACVLLAGEGTHDNKMHIT